MTHLIDKTDNLSLRNAGIEAFARQIGAFAADHSIEMRDIALSKVTGVYAFEAEQPLTDSWEQLPKLSTVLEWVSQGFISSRMARGKDTESTYAREITTARMQVSFQGAIPALQAIASAIDPDTLQKVVTNLMLERDSAVDTLLAKGDGLLGLLHRRITAKRAMDFHASYFKATPEDGLARALTHTARTVCREFDCGVAKGGDPLVDIETLVEGAYALNGHDSTALNEIADFVEEHRQSIRLKAA